MTNSLQAFEMPEIQNPNIPQLENGKIGVISHKYDKQTRLLGVMKESYSDEKMSDMVRTYLMEVYRTEEKIQLPFVVCTKMTDFDEYEIQVTDPIAERVSNAPPDKYTLRVFNPQ